MPARRRKECPRYRCHLHKAIVFPLLLARLPRTWRGCHSALGPLSSAFTHISRGSGALLSICLVVSFFPLVVPSSSPFVPHSSLSSSLSTFPPSHSSSPSVRFQTLPIENDRTPCLRYLARIPAYNYTGLRLCISCVTLGDFRRETRTRVKPETRLSAVLGSSPVPAGAALRCSAWLGLMGLGRRCSPA